MNDVAGYVEKNKARFLEELKELLAIPSISADSAYKEDVQRAADRVKEFLEEAGVGEARIYETEGHPIVYGELISGEDKPTVLIYGHYDVQPPDPLDLWDSPPFEPVVNKTEEHPQGAIFARGACDDKGQIFMHIKALEAMVAADHLPVNFKFVFEGEEEVGSVHLEIFLKEHADLLTCDVVLISDSAMLSNEHPSITTGLRGLSYVEVEVTGPNRDLHSGVYGGSVANPINVLAKMIASLHDGNGHITIPGFYDRVKRVAPEERQAMNAAPFDKEEFKEDLGVDRLQGEKGYTTLERVSIRPTLDVNGIWGGYTGEGAKTVLPSKAYAKISMRLVPDQDYEEITRLFTAHFKSIAPASVQVNVTPHHGGPPAVTPIDSDEYKAAEEAMEKTFGKKPFPMRGGGSIPIVALFEDILDVNVVLMGFGLDSDNIHSPNEKFGLFNFYKGIETIPWYHEFYAARVNGKTS